MVTLVYITCEEAADLIGQCLGTAAGDAYTKLDLQDRQALIHSTQFIFEALPWIGAKESEDQIESWPRRINGEVTPVPPRVKLALVQQMAPKLMRSEDTGLIRELTTLGVSSYRIDDLAVTMESSAKQSTAVSPVRELTMEALTLLRPYLLLGGACDVYA